LMKLIKSMTFLNYQEINNLKPKEKWQV